jgi:hypothetical protein
LCFRDPDEPAAGPHDGNSWPRFVEVALGDYEVAVDVYEVAVDVFEAAVGDYEVAADVFEAAVGDYEVAADVFVVAIDVFAQRFLLSFSPFGMRISPTGKSLSFA